ncbi:GntR family transcriptional regulator [Lactobacillus sp. ESL0245]|nr:GntR family transcriptional regulator [Lactobacillus sp. ESL0247]RMC27407.1 GntR family transcriptional regulator [Lactobacillus sp. ESL0246]RMC30608.1 GntR family transcriptional regulator [Lactobacillus sp. ESL0245]RMC47647.1 GntR family transcriptional regulator [Lactobacillus sp. ESL0228]
MLLFKEIYTDLKLMISKSDYPPGSSLPTEAELQHRYKVSRTTVRKAVDQLVAENKVIRKKGSGLFVAPVISKQNILEMTGVIKPSYIGSSDMIKFKDSYLRLVGYYYANIFHISSNELLYYISFITVINDQLTWEKLLLPLVLFPGFDPSCLKVMSIIEAVGSGKLRPANLLQELQIIKATDEIAKQLKIKKQGPIFKTTNLFSTKRGKIVAVEYRLQDALTTKYSIDF